MINILYRQSQSQKTKFCGPMGLLGGKDSKTPVPTHYYVRSISLFAILWRGKQGLKVCTTLGHYKWKTRRHQAKIRSLLLERRKNFGGGFKHRRLHPKVVEDNKNIVNQAERCAVRSDKNVLQVISYSCKSILVQPTHEKTSCKM